MLNDDIKKFVSDNYESFVNFDDKVFNELCMLIREVHSLKFYLHKIVNDRITRTPNVTLYDESGMILMDATRIYNSAQKYYEKGVFRGKVEDVRASMILKEIFQMVRYIIDFKNIDNCVESDKTPIRHGYMVRLGNFNLDLYANSEIDMYTCDKIFYANRDLYPNERRARIQAIKGVIDCYKDYSFCSEELISDLLIILLETKMGGYSRLKGELVCPLYKFYSLVGNLDHFAPQFYDYYSLDERIEMGMPLSEEELSTTIIDTLELNHNDEKVRKFARNYVK